MLYIVLIGTRKLLVSYFLLDASYILVMFSYFGKTTYHRYHSSSPHQSSLKTSPAKLKEISGHSRVLLAEALSEYSYSTQREKEKTMYELVINLSSGLS